MPEFTLLINNMHCGACVRRVTEALSSAEGIEVKEVLMGTARLSSPQDPPPVALALHALAKAGYPAHLQELISSSPTESLTLPVLGMTCASCQHHVEEALRSTAGVESARIMRQNLLWAIAYNLLGIPLAAGLFYPAVHILFSPWLAGAAMALSSVCVLGNSLRLRRWRPALA
jgi:Cu+-exporting ATPase